MAETGNHRTRDLVVAGSVLLTMIFGGLDYLAHPGLSFLLFYLFPLVLASWFGGFGAGLLVTALSVAAWFGNDWLVSSSRPELWDFVWYLLTKVILFVFVAWVLASLRKSGRTLRAARLTDTLTGLGTRPRFFANAETEISRARRYKHPFSIVLMDVDGLADINRSSGHAAGDRVLAGLGRLLAANIRKSDFAARVGEDEFAVWLPETRFEPAAAWVARLGDRVPELVPAAGIPLTLTLAALTFRLLPASADEVLRAAEEALASAKSEGRGLVTHRVWGAGEGPPAPRSGP